MSNNDPQHPEQNQSSAHHEQPPAWAIALLQRIESLEGRSSPIEDPAISTRPSDTEFHPYPAFVDALPSTQKDFFRSPLPEVERRRFLADCPRNVDREYLAPVLNNVNVHPNAKRQDHQLADIQFRLSGITRPIDQFVHHLICNNGTSREHALDFANVVHELLVDTASYITQLRIDNMFKASGIQGQAPHLASSGPSALLDPWELVEHVKLATAVQQTGKRLTRHNKKGKAHSFNNTNRADEGTSASHDNNTNQKPGFTAPKKGFHSGPQNQNKSKQQSNSQ